MHAWHLSRLPYLEKQEWNPESITFLCFCLFVRKLRFWCNMTGHDPIPHNLKCL
jgi:hypothetical protein